MKLTIRNAILVFVSQLGAWLLLILLFLLWPSNKLLIPAVNNRPAAFTISIWLMQTLLITNAVTYIINRIWPHARNNNTSDARVQSIKFSILNILVSIAHIITFCVLFLIIFGGEDL